MAKTIKVLIEMPSNWIDFDSPIGFLSGTIRQMVENKVRDAVVEEYVKKVGLPKIKITKNEIKLRIIDKLAEKALERQDNE